MRSIPGIFLIILLSGLAGCVLAYKEDESGPIEVFKLACSMAFSHLGFKSLIKRGSYGGGAGSDSGDDESASATSTNAASGNVYYANPTTSAASFPWGNPTVVVAPSTATPTPLIEGKPVRYTINANEVHKYEFQVPNIDDALQNVFVTANTCDEPYISEYMDLNDTQVLSLFAANNNITGHVMEGSYIMNGFANVTLTNVQAGTALAEIVAPPLPSGYHGQWTYEIGISTNAPVHAVSSDSNLFLVDTDYAHALFVTGNYTTLSNGAQANITDYNIYAFASAGSDVSSWQNQLSQFSNRLGSSYCAVSTGPALINTNNTKVSSTTRGWGSEFKGQYFMSGLNKSESYNAFLTQPNLGGGGGIVFQPVYFTAKSEENCQLVYNMDFCSDIAYAAPGNASAFSADSLGKFYDGIAAERYKNFTFSLQNVQCNASNETRFTLLRDCDDCANAYQQWLCAVTIPRCTDWTANDTFLFPRPVGTSRNPLVNEVIKPGPYKEVLPCIDLCYRLVQDCDPNLGFACPKFGRGFEQSYGQMDNDGWVSCSYPGAVYKLSAGLRLRAMQSLGWLAMFWMCALL